MPICVSKHLKLLKVCMISFVSFPRKPRSLPSWNVGLYVLRRWPFNLIIFQNNKTKQKESTYA